MTAFDTDDLPYAAADIKDRRIILDARNRAEALADNPGKIRLYIQETTVYERTFTPADLDEAAPGWREALARPHDHDAPGRSDLEGAALEDLDDGEEVEAYARLSIHLGLTDRTPTHVQLRRTLADGTVADQTVTVEADDLDDVSWHWRNLIDADPAELAAHHWSLDSIARYAEAHRRSDAEPRPAASVEVRSITQ